MRPTPPSPPTSLSPNPRFQEDEEQENDSIHNDDAIMQFDDDKSSEPYADIPFDGSASQYSGFDDINSPNQISLSSSTATIVLLGLMSLLSVISSVENYSKPVINTGYNNANGGGYNPGQTAACTGICGTMRFLALLVGGLSLFFCLWHLAITYGCSQQYTEKAQITLCVLLCLLWSVATVVLTANSDFILSTSGYLATWSCLAISCILVYGELKQVQKIVDGIRDTASKRLHNRAAVYLIFSSSIVIISMISPCIDGANNNQGCQETIPIGFTLAGFSILCSLYLALRKPSEVGEYGKYIAVFLVVDWLVALAILTFIAPFYGFGTGLVGCWTSLFCTFMILSKYVKRTYR